MESCVQNICTSNQPRDWHHEHLSLLKQHAEASCIFCNTLLGDLRVEGLDVETPVDGFMWPPYTWQVNKSATAQGIQEMVIITFRPVVPDDVSETRMKIVSLLERKLYLYLEQGKVAIDADLQNSHICRSWHASNQG